MKTGFFDLFKLIVIAVTALVVCILAYFMITTTNEGKSMATGGTTQIKGAAAGYQDISKSIYDGNTLLGDAVVDLIEYSIEEEQYVSIVVQTLANPTGAHYNYTHIVTTNKHSISLTGTPTPLTTVTEDKSSINYINKGAQFEGEVFKDVNNNVVAIVFEQKK